MERRYVISWRAYWCNINENTFEEIWYGKKYQKLREEMLNKKISKNSICYECKDRYSGNRFIKNES